MTDQINDQISAFIDNELSADESALLVRRFERDPEARARAMRYTADRRVAARRAARSASRRFCGSALRLRCPALRRAAEGPRAALARSAWRGRCSVSASPPPSPSSPIGALRSLNEARSPRWNGAARGHAAPSETMRPRRRATSCRRTPTRSRPCATDPADELPHAPRRVRFGSHADVGELERRRAAMDHRHRDGRDQAGRAEQGLE